MCIIYSWSMECVHTEEFQESIGELFLAVLVKVSW